METSTSIPFETFYAFARDRHEGQVSKSGEPYFEHIIRVLERTRVLLDALPEGLISVEDAEEALLVALGHDLIEDERTTEEELRALGASDRLISRLKALSRMDPKPVYQGWIMGIAVAGDLVTIIVKMADNLDNNSDERISHLSAEERSIRKRYDRAFVILDAALQEAISAYLASTPGPSRR